MQNEHVSVCVGYRLHLREENILKAFNLPDRISVGTLTTCALCIVKFTEILQFTGK